MDFVLDCSVSMAWFHKEETTSFTEKVLDSLISGNCAYVPSLWIYEVGNVFLVSERRKRISKDNIQRFIEQLSFLPIRVDEAASLIVLTDMMELGRTYGLSNYDAAYLELAKRKNLPLVTLDDEIIKAANEVGVIVLSEKEF